MALSLLGYFLYMITALSAVVAAMIGLLNFSTSESVRHYPRPVAERNETAATNSEPRLFMAVPETKDGPPANVEVNSAAVATEKTNLEKNKPHKPKVLARQRDRYEKHDYAMSVGHAEGSGGYRPGLDAQR